MITVHHLGVSQSERIGWLCEELDIPYKLICYERDAVTRLAPSNYKALHPIHTAPVITDGDLVLAESGAIMEYILAKYGNGRLTVTPRDANYADYLFWFHFANASMMPAEMIGFIAAVLGASNDNEVVKALKVRGEVAFDLCEKRLGAVDYFAGSEFTAADIIMLFPLTTMRAFTQRDLAPYPQVRHYLQRIGARPAYQRAMSKGDPGMTPMLA